MADNTGVFTPSGNETVATDDIGGIKYQRVKISQGADGSAADVHATAPIATYMGVEGTYFCRYLDTNGDGTGTKNANGDYSGAADEFFLAPGAGQEFHVYRLLVSLADTGSLDADKYGNGITLTNGISVEVQDASTTLIDLVDGINITTNAQWAHLCHDLAIYGFGVGNEHMSVRWTFTRGGQPLRLVGDSGHKLVVTLNDDLTGLLDHHFVAQGISV